MTEPARSAATLSCRACGGAVGPDDLRCPHCGSQVATVACPQCFAMVPVRAAHCPQCGAATVQEITRTAEDLARVAEGLKDVVKAFRLREGPP